MVSTGRSPLDKTEKSITTTSRCFVKPDTSILVRIGHFGFGLTKIVFPLDMPSHLMYILSVLPFCNFPNHDPEAAEHRKGHRTLKIEISSPGFS